MALPLPYAFQGIVSAISGPGGNFNLGYGAGNAEDAIHITMVEEKVTTVTGADGSIMHSLHAGQTGMMTFRLLKTSPVNQALSLLFNAQRSLPALAGQNVVRCQDINRGDVIVGSQMAFVKFPDIVYAKDGNVMEWQLRGIIVQELGAGVVDVNT